MQEPAVPENEVERLDALRRYNVLDTLPERAYDDLAALASFIAGSPIALVSLVDQNRQWFKSKVGLDATETPRDISFCGHVVANRQMLVVPDATKDQRFADNPLVEGAPDIRFYAGAPLVTPDNQYIGTLCVIDREPRELEPEQQEMLQALARQVVRLLELRVSVGRLEKSERRLQAAIEAERDANEAKSAFLANMSHELRTPMNAILGYSEMLQEEATDAGQENLVSDVQKIHAAGKHLLVLINDILDLSKIEAGKMVLSLETFDLPQLVNEVADTVRPLVAKNSNTFEVRCSPDVGTMHSDLTRIRQVLFNMLSNAAKFTEMGVISLAVEPAMLNGEAGIRFIVSDNGIGMDEQQVAQVFDPFTQGDNSTSRKYGGTGLGLTICRKFCRMMGGDIAVTSAPGEGTTLAVHVPACVEQAELLDAAP